MVMRCLEFVCLSVVRISEKVVGGYGDIWYGDGVDNAGEENSSIFSLIQLH